MERTSYQASQLHFWGTTASKCQVVKPESWLCACCCSAPPSVVASQWPSLDNEVRWHVINVNCVVITGAGALVGTSFLLHNYIGESLEEESLSRCKFKIKRNSGVFNGFSELDVLELTNTSLILELSMSAIKRTTIAITKNWKTLNVCICICIKEISVKYLA